MVSISSAESWGKAELPPAWPLRGCGLHARRVALGSGSLICYYLSSAPSFISCSPPVG